MKVTLEKVRAVVTSGLFESSEPWNGADVSVVDRKAQRSFAVYSFFPEPLQVVTAHVGPVSWLFEQMRDCFGDINGYGMFKEDLFAHLGAAVNDLSATSPEISARELLLAVLDVADALHLQFVADAPAIGGGGGYGLSDR